MTPEQLQKLRAIAEEGNFPKENFTNRAYQDFISNFDPPTCLSLLAEISSLRSTLQLIVAYDPKKGLVKIQPMEALRQIHFYACVALGEKHE